MLEMYLRYARDMPEICMRYAWDITDICLRFPNPFRKASHISGQTEWVTEWVTKPCLEMLAHPNRGAREIRLQNMIFETQKRTVSKRGALYLKKWASYSNFCPLRFKAKTCSKFSNLNVGYSLWSSEILEVAGALTHDSFMTISFSSRARSSRTAPNCLTEILGCLRQLSPS